MDVVLKDCPECGAALLDESNFCHQCGAQLVPAAENPVAESARLIAPVALLDACPTCQAEVPRGVVRCRECGGLMQPELEQAVPDLAARVVNGGAVSRWQPAVEADPNALEEADELDFQLAPEIDLIDGSPEGEPVAATQDDDFQLSGDYTVVEEAASDEYAAAPAGDYGSAFDVEGGAAGGDDDYALNLAQPTDDDTVLEGPGGGSVFEENLTDQGGTSDDTQVISPGSPEPVEESTTVDETPAADTASHSVATAGDALLAAAMQEEAESSRRQRLGLRGRRKPEPGVSLVVYCPNGHRVLVAEKYRGRQGRCPNCKAPFFVPVAPMEKPAADAAADSSAVAGSAGASPAAEGAAAHWITDVHLHRVQPTKLKIKPDSLLHEYDTADLGLAADSLLLAVVFAGGGMLRSMQEPKKKPLNRQALRDHLVAGGPLDALPVPLHRQLTAEQLPQIKVVQPSVPGEESLFADIPIFGTGRIAIRLPLVEANHEWWYVSFTLSQFREFSQHMQSLFGIEALGRNAGIPLEDAYSDFACHYSEAPLRALEHLEFYRADSSYALQVIGRRCQGCGLIVSEDSRKKEKIGGTSDSSVAKAKCPKCKQKFGDQALYTLKAAAPA